MSNKYSYYIEVRLRIIFIAFAGSVKVNDIKEALTLISSHPNYSKNYDQVVDFRSCNLDIKIDELTDFVDFITHDLEIDGSRSDIYITSKPNEVVLTILFSKLIKDLQIQPHVVSTVQRTLGILLRDGLELNDISSNLDRLSSNLAKED